MAQRNTAGPGSWSGAPGSAYITIQVNFVSNEGSEVISPDTLYNQYSVIQAQTISLASGFNSLTIPVSTGTTRIAAGVIIQMPSSNAQTAILKGVTGDTGIAISPTGITGPICFPATVTSASDFGITAGAAINGVRVWWF